MDVNDILTELRRLANPDKVKLKEAKFGIVAKNSLGIYQKELKVLAKTIDQNDELALQLFDTGIYEARILCSKLFKSDSITEELMEKWVITFENWEVCDSFCMGFFARSDYALPKAIEWSTRKNEFEKRAGFVLMACYGFANKSAANKVFEQFFPIIKREAIDERLYVKKAVNWALRNIGKRNIDLNKKAIKVACQILKMNTKSANWIAKDALRELQKPDVNILDYPREKYRNG